MGKSIGKLSKPDTSSPPFEQSTEHRYQEAAADSRAYLTIRVHFSALHELRSPDLSEGENKRVFGKCFRTHGHDYYLEVTVQGAIDPDSGLCYDREKLWKILETEVVLKFNGTHLNHHFKSTTGEELAREFYELLSKKLEPKFLVGVRLQETPKNFFSYPNYL